MSQSVIKPTVGRVMWFYHYVPGQGHTGPLSASVAKVHSDDCVNLMVVSEEGVPRSEVNIHLIQEGEECLEGASYCEWMPYQVGQAKKTEQAETVAEAARRGFNSK